MVNSVPDLDWAGGLSRGGLRRTSTSSDGVILAAQPLPGDRKQRKVTHCCPRAQTVVLRELLNEVVLEGGQVDSDPQTSQSPSWGVTGAAWTVDCHPQSLKG